MRFNVLPILSFVLAVDLLKCHGQPPLNTFEYYKHLAGGNLDPDDHSVIEVLQNMAKNMNMGNEHELDSTQSFADEGEAYAPSSSWGLPIADPGEATWDHRSPVAQGHQLPNQLAGPGYAPAHPMYGSQLGYSDGRLGYSEGHLGYSDGHLGYSDGHLDYSDVHLSHRGSFPSHADSDSSNYGSRSGYHDSHSGNYGSRSGSDDSHSGNYGRDAPASDWDDEQEDPRFQATLLDSIAASSGVSRLESSGVRPARKKGQSDVRIRGGSGATVPSQQGADYGGVAAEPFPAGRRGRGGPASKMKPTLSGEKFDPQVYAKIYGRWPDE